MIIGIGIDSIEIERFSHWNLYEQKKLQQIFTSHEIEYCLSCPRLSAERFAARFAAKEAFFKALFGSQLVSHKMRSRGLRALARSVEVVKRENGSVALNISWHEILENVPYNQIQAFLSLTHSRTYATAMVILEHGNV